MSISVWDFFSGTVGQLALAGMVVNTAEQSRPKSNFQFQEKWNLIEFSMPNVSERNILTSQLVWYAGTAILLSDHYCRIY